MKHIIFGTALATVIASPAWAQVQADADWEYDTACQDQNPIDYDLPVSERDIVIACSYHGDKDWIIVSGRLGYDEEQVVTSPVSVLSQYEIAARGQQYVSGQPIRFRRRAHTNPYARRRS
jgi:hypothetical protein